MKKLLLLLITSGILLTSCLSDNTSETNINKNSTIYNYGYAKFTISPYSNTMAVTAYNTSEGITRLTQSQYKTAFYSLSTHYSPQENILSCGIASAAIILNTVYTNIGKTPPISVTGSWFIPEDNAIDGNFTWTENNFFNDKINGYLDKEVIYGRKKVDGKYQVGVTLEQLTNALNMQGLIAEKVNVESSTNEDIEVFREMLKKELANPTKYIIANYNLNVMSTLNGGHFSPLIAYDENSDSVLIMDTWNAFAPWTWVKVYDLYKSMNTKDGDTYRGYILINTNSAS